MKRIKLSVLILFSCCFCFSTYADTGCQLSNGSIYSPQTGSALLGATLVPLNLGISIPYYNSPTIPTGISTCPSWAGNIVPTGRLCTTQALTVLGLGLVAQNQGQEVSYSLIQCNLDDYTWALGAAAGVFGLIVLRRRQR